MKTPLMTIKTVVVLLMLSQLASAAIPWCDIYSVKEGTTDKENSAELRVLTKAIGKPAARLNTQALEFDSEPSLYTHLEGFLKKHNCANVFLRIGGTAKGTSFRNKHQALVQISSINVATELHKHGNPALYISSCDCKLTPDQRNANNVKLCMGSAVSPIEHAGRDLGWLALPPSPNLASDTQLQTHYQPVQEMTQVSEKTRSKQAGLRVHRTKVAEKVTGDGRQPDPNLKTLSPPYAQCLKNIAKDKSNKLVCLYTIASNGAVKAKMFDPRVDRFVDNPSAAIAKFINNPCSQEGKSKYIDQGAAALEASPLANCGVAFKEYSEKPKKLFF